MCKTKGALKENVALCYKYTLNSVNTFEYIEKEKKIENRERVKAKETGEGDALSAVSGWRKTEAERSIHLLMILH